jgi:hypothetical protein
VSSKIGDITFVLWTNQEEKKDSNITLLKIRLGIGHPVGSKTFMIYNLQVNSFHTFNPLEKLNNELTHLIYEMFFNVSLIKYVMCDMKRSGM